MCSNSLSCTVDSLCGRNTPEASPVQSRKAESPPWTMLLLMQPRIWLLSGLWGHITGSCSASNPPVPVSSFQQSCAQCFHPLACICCGGCLNPGTGPCTWICWTSWGSPGPTVHVCLETLYLRSQDISYQPWLQLKRNWYKLMNAGGWQDAIWSSVFRP